MPIMAKSNDEYTEVKAIKTPNGTEIDYVLSKVDNTYKRTYTAIRELEDAPPLNFKSIKPNANLIDYRIYGQTVDGESVGDRTGNLFDKNSPEIQNGVYVDDSGTFINSVYHQLSPYITCIANYTYRLYMERAIRSDAFGVYVNLWDSNKQFIKNIYVARLPSEYQTLSIRFIPSENGFITFNFLNNADITKNVMFYKSSTFIPYEPYGYKVPVTVSNGTDTLTTPIYLPEQIKKVGDEAEYIDYGEQKQHRVRKNLFDYDGHIETKKGITFTPNSDGSITCTGTAQGDVYHTEYSSLEIGTYVLNGTPNGLQSNAYLFVNANASTVGLSSNVVDYDGTGALFTATQSGVIGITIYIKSGYTCDNLTFYPMIRKADIEDDTYEPYIENTDLDITLPALPTVAGTNTLTVGTEVQPSDMYIKGNFKMIAGGGE